MPMPMPMPMPMAREATVFSHLQMVKPLPDGGRILLVGHYDDIVRKVDGQWLFAQRIVVSDA